MRLFSGINDWLYKRYEFGWDEFYYRLSNESQRYQIKLNGFRATSIADTDRLEILITNQPAS